MSKTAVAIFSPRNKPTGGNGLDWRALVESRPPNIGKLQQKTQLRKFNQKRTQTSDFTQKTAQKRGFTKKKVFKKGNSLKKANLLRKELFFFFYKT